MTSKRVKAWAVVDKDGVPFECDDGSLAIFDAKGFALNEYDAIGGAPPERVVPVTIIVEGE